MRPTVQSPDRLRHRHPAGFTLLEVIAAMGLITFVIGGVYGIADATLRLSTSMSNARVSEARVTNFMNQWRACLENLPPGTKLTAGSRAGSSGEARLLLENCGTPFAWSRAALAAAAVEFSVVREEHGGASLMLRHLKRPARATSGDDYFTIAELPLLEGVKALTWEFFDPGTKDWTDKWDDPARLPLYLRLRLAFTEDSVEHESTFWMSGAAPGPAAPPPQQPPGANPQS